MTRMALAVGSALFIAACAPVSDATRLGAASSLDAATLVTCEESFQAWVDGAASLNDPNVDLVEAIAVQETIQLRVFESCTLADAEKYNTEILLEMAPGDRRPLIEPDFRKFAEVECVDESPLFDDTSICAEVAR